MSLNHEKKCSLFLIHFIISVLQTMSPQAGLKHALLQSQAQANRKSSLNAVIDKLKSEIADTIMTPPSEKKGEYQIKSSGTSSDGIKITFNKTKKSSESKSPKHTGLKPGKNDFVADKVLELLEKVLDYF